MLLADGDCESTELPRSDECTPRGTISRGVDTVGVDAEESKDFSLRSFDRNTGARRLSYNGRALRTIFFDSEDWTEDAFADGCYLYPTSDFRCSSALILSNSIRMYCH